MVQENVPDYQLYVHPGGGVLLLASQLPLRARHVLRVLLAGVRGGADQHGLPFYLILRLLFCRYPFQDLARTHWATCYVGE